MSDANDNPRLSIGAVSEATDIPTATLRTWERRYGFPDPERTDAGHRRYRPAVIDRLRLTARALDAGHRPSDVVGLSTEALEDLLADVGDASTTEREPSAEPPSEDWLFDWLEAVAALDDDALERHFRSAWNEVGAIAFLQRRAAPFLRSLGNAWARDQLSVAHEHHGSEKLRQFLSDQWRPMTGGSAGPTVVLATPEDELHAVGLHMIAVVFGLANWDLTFIGPNTPADDVVEAAAHTDPAAVGISIAASYDDRRARESLAAIRDGLPPMIDLLAGGEGVPADVDGILHIDDLSELYKWAKKER